MSTETERITAAVAGLGDDEETIIARLKAAGALGVVGSACGCPVANYLTGRGFERVRIEDGRIETATASILQPVAISEFVALFDLGLVKDLIEEDA